MNTTPSGTNPTPSEITRRIIHTLQEEMDTLRLSVKYLVFDLEATRRENEQLRRMLAERE